MCEDNKKVWNSLEIIKLLVAASIPLVVLIVGYHINEQIKADTAARELQTTLQMQQWKAEHSKTEFSRAQLATQASQIVKERVKLWRDIAVPLNDMYAYFMYVGTWKELKASDIIARKRETDKIIHSYRPFYSDEFYSAYKAYMKALFSIGRGWGEDAGLKTKHDHREHEKDTSLFMEIDNSDDVHERYFSLLDIAAKEMNLVITKPSGRPQMPPANNKPNNK